MATKKTSNTTAKKAAKSTSAEAEAPKPAKAAATKALAKTAAKKAATTSEAKPAAKKAASHDEISKHAHSLWEQHGRHHGSHVEHWLRAEKELNS